MLPPRLVYYLQSLITRKLLESPMFHKLVAKTDGALSSLRQALVEGWQEAGKELDRQRRSPNNAQEPTDPIPSTQRRSSADPQSTQPKESSSTPDYHPDQNSTDAERDRLETEQQLKDILEKLRRHDKNT